MGAGGDRGRPAHRSSCARPTSRATSASPRCTRGGCSAWPRSSPPAPASRPAPRASPPSGGEVQSSDGDDRLRRQRRRRDVRVLARPRAVRALHVAGHLHRPAARRPRAARRGDRPENGVSELEAAVYEWEVLEPFDDTPPETTLERAPADGSSSTLFEFTGTDDLTPPAQLSSSAASTAPTSSTGRSCESPYNLLDHYTYARPPAGARPARLRGARARRVRAAVPTRQPRLRQRRPVAGPPRVDLDRRHERARAPASRPARAAARPRPRRPSSSSAPTTRRPAHLVEFECSLDGAPFEPCSSPETSRSSPARTRCRSARSTSPATPTRRPRSARGRSSARRWRRSRPARGPHLPGQSGPPAPSTEERAIFTFTADQPDATFECSVDGADFAPCTSPHQAFAVDDGDHEFEVRGVSALRPPPASRSSRTRRRATSGAPCSAPTRRARTRRSPPARRPRRWTRSRRSPFTRLRQPHAARAAAVRVLARRRGRQRLRVARGVHRPRARPARAAGARPRPRRQPRRDAGALRVDGRAAARGRRSPSGPGRGLREHEREVHLRPPTCPARRSSAGSTARSHRLHVAGDLLRPGRRRAHLRRARDLARRPPRAASGRSRSGSIGDTTPPITTIHCGPDVTTEDTRAEFAFTSNEPGVTFMCSLDGADPVPCSSPLVYARLHAGRAPARGDRHRRRRCWTASASRSSPTTTRSRPSTSGRSSTRSRPNASIDWGPRATTVEPDRGLRAQLGRPDRGRSSARSTAAASRVRAGHASTPTSPAAAHTLRSARVDLLGNVDQTPARARLDDHAARPAEHAGRHERHRDAADARRAAATRRCNFFDVDCRGHDDGRRPQRRPRAAGRLHAGRRALLRRRHDRRLQRAGHALPRLRPGALPDDRGPAAAARRHDVDRRHDDEQPVHRADLRQRGRRARERRSSLFAIAAANTGVAPLVSILSGPPVRVQQRDGDVRAVRRHARRARSSARSTARRSCRASRR